MNDLLIEPSPDMPKCGQCGYIVRGVAGVHCPECGADLREVGIVTGKSGLGVVVWAVVFSIIFGIVACVLTGISVEYIGPRSYHRSESLSLSSPSSGKYKQIDINAAADKVVWFPRSSNNNRQVSFEQVQLVIVAHDGTTKQIDIDTVTMGYRYTGKDGKAVSANQGLNQQIMLDWMKTVGVDTADNDVQTEANSLLAAGAGGFMNMQKQGFNGISGSSSSGSGTSNEGMFGMIIFWFLVWGVCVWLIIRKKRPKKVGPNG
jgi:hypothetical protein